MSELPKGWTKSTLGESCLRASKVNPKDEPEKEITYLDIGGIDNETLTVAKTKTYRGADAPSRARQLVEEGDVLFSTVRTYLRKIAQVPALYDGGIASTGFTVLRSSKALDPKYLFYYVTQDTFLKPLSKIQRGTSYPSVRDSDVFEQPIILAPLLEQRRIVARIEELFSRCDAGAAALRNAKVQLQRYRQSVLAAAVTGQLTQAWREQHPDTEPAKELLERILKNRRNTWSGRGKYKKAKLSDGGLPFEIPSSWSVASFDQISSQVTVGHVGSMKDRYKDKGVPFLRSQNVRPMRFAPENLVYIDSEFDSILTKSRLFGNEILLTRSGANVGQCCVYPETHGQANCSDLVIARPLHEINPHFGALFMNSPQGRRLLHLGKVGNAQAHFNVGSMKVAPLPLPPLTEQHQIVAEVEARTTTAARLEAELDRQITRSDRLRQSTLSSAFSGRLVSQDPSDEPANALLKRTRTLHKEMPKKRTRTKKIASKRATAVRNKDELVALLQQLGGSVTPERLLIESKLEDHIDTFFELIREAGVDSLINAPVGEFGEIFLPES